MKAWTTEGKEKRRIARYQHKGLEIAPVKNCLEFLKYVTVKGIFYARASLQ